MFKLKKKKKILKSYRDSVLHILTIKRKTGLRERERERERERAMLRLTMSEHVNGPLNLKNYFILIT